MAFEAAYVVVTAPATTGTSDVTISGFGVPEAVMVFGNNLGADGTTTDALMSVGAWDGTNQWSYFTWSDDNVGTSNLVTGHNTDGIVADETAFGAWCAQVTATSVTDGIEVSWKNDALSRRYLFVFFKGANGATAWNYYYGLSTPDYTKTFTHNNDFTFLYHDSRSSYVSQGALSCNLLHYDGTSYNRCGLTWAGRDGQATTANCINLNSTDCGPVLQYAASLYTIATSRPTATQLKIDISNDHPRTNFFGLTFDLDDDEDVAIGYDYENITPPTTESYTIATGFEPGFMGFVGTRIRTIDADRTDADASSLSFGVTDGTNGFSLGFRDADGVSTTSCDSWQDDATTLGVIEHNNDTITHDADISSFDSNGYTLYWNAALSAARYHLYWAIKTGIAAQDILPTGYSQGATYGESTINPGAADITPAGYAQVLNYGATSATGGPVDLAAAGLAVSIFAGDSLIEPGPVDLLPVGLVQPAGLGFSSVNPSPVELAPTGLAVSVPIGFSSLFSGPRTIIPNSITISLAYGNPSMKGVTGLAPFGLAVTQTIGNPDFSFGVTPPGTEQTISIGSPTLVASSAGDIAAIGIEMPIVFGTPTLFGPQSLSPSGVAIYALVGSPGTNQPGWSNRPDTAATWADAADTSSVWTDISDTSTTWTET